MKALVPRPHDALTSDARSPLADPGTRLAAQVIDGILPFLPFAILYLSGALVGSVILIRSSFVAAVLMLVTQILLNLYWLHRYGQTIGKRLLGIRIVRGDGERVTLGRILLLRMILPGGIGMIPILGPLFSTADPLLIFSEERRCIHDRFADTIVVDVRHAPSTEAAPETF